MMNSAIWGLDNGVVAAALTVVGAVVAAIGGAIGSLWRKSRERESIRNAILAEIKRLLDVIEGHLRWLQKEEVDLSKYPLIPFRYSIFPQNIKSIGILEPAVVANVVQFFGYVDFLNSLQAARSHYADPKAFERQYRRSLRNFLFTFQSAFTSHFERLNYLPYQSAENPEGRAAGG